MDIVEPVAPENVAPESFNRLAGDWSDDDGPALDEYFEAPSHEPLSHDTLPEPTAKVALPVITRILAKEFTLGNGTIIYDPVMLFPADPNRKELIIAADATTIVIASDKNGCYNGATMLTLTTAAYWTTKTHTGAVWVYNTAAAAANVRAWSITE